jgi:hypothetical protein
VLNHRVIGLEQYLEALAEQDASGPVEAPGAVAVEASAPVAGPRKLVAHKGGGVSVEVLGPDYRRIMTVFKDAGGGNGLTAKQVAEAHVVPERPQEEWSNTCVSCICMSG